MSSIKLWNDSPWTVVLSVENCRLIDHGRNKDRTIAEFDVMDNAQWWAVIGIMNSESAGGLYSRFFAAKDIIETNETVCVRD